MGYVVTIADCVIIWKTELQDIFVFSTIETEYMTAVETSKEALWLKGLIEF